MCSTIINHHITKIQQELRKIFLKKLKPGDNLHKEAVWVTKPLYRIGKKAVQKMKTHASSESHLRQVEAELLANTGQTIVHKQQRLRDSEKSKNRKVIKALFRCTHYLCKQHIPHTSTHYIVEFFSVFAKEMPAPERDTKGTRPS